MADFIIIGILFVLSTAAGFISGNTENGLKRQKWFFIGPGIVFAGIAALMGWMAFRMCELKELLFSYVGPKIPQVSEKLPLELTSNVIPDSLIYWIFSVIALLAVLSFLVAFNCRRSAKNPWISIGGIVCASAIFNFGSVWAFYGIGAFLVIFGKYSRKYPTGETSIAVLVFLTLFCIIWTWYSFSGKRFGWKVLLTQLGIFAMSLAVCWLLALAVAYPYANKMKMRTERENAVVFQFQAEADYPAEAKSTAAGIDAFYNKHTMFELPFASIYLWRKDGKAGESVPRKQREYTLKLFDSPEVHELCRMHEQLFKYASSKEKLFIPILNALREYARICAGRAALFRETNQPEKILPELMKITVLDRNVLNGTPFTISELVRNACRVIWFSEMVRLGPDFPEYAPIYRDALKFMKSRKVHLPSETGYYLGFFPKIKSGTYKEFLTLPSAYAMIGRGLSHQLDRAAKLPEAEKQEVFPNLSEDYENQALRGRLSIVMGTTMLALKCYRVEHGSYPDKLEKLVPEYLEKNFVCPYTGKPLKYESDGRNFTLAPHRKVISTSLNSKAQY